MTVFDGLYLSEIKYEYKILRYECVHNEDKSKSTPLVLQNFRVDLVTA